MTQPLFNLPTASVLDATALKRLVIRWELHDGRPVVLLVLEYDAALGTADCQADELLDAVGQVIRGVAQVVDAECRVFSGTILDGRRNFIEWAPTDDGRLTAIRNPDTLPPSLVTCELLNESLAQYGEPRRMSIQ
jgi:hypothetical protein